MCKCVCVSVCVTSLSCSLGKAVIICRGQRRSSRAYLLDSTLSLVFSIGRGGASKWAASVLIRGVVTTLWTTASATPPTSVCRLLWAVASPVSLLVAVETLATSCGRVGHVACRRIRRWIGAGPLILGLVEESEVDTMFDVSATLLVNVSLFFLSFLTVLCMLENFRQASLGIFNSYTGVTDEASQTSLQTSEKILLEHALIWPSNITRIGFRALHATMIVKCLLQPSEKVSGVFIFLLYAGSDFSHVTHYRKLSADRINKTSHPATVVDVSLFRVRGLPAGCLEGLTSLKGLAVSVSSRPTRRDAGPVCWSGGGGSRADGAVAGREGVWGSW